MLNKAWLRLFRFLRKDLEHTHLKYHNHMMIRNQRYLVFQYLEKYRTVTDSNDTIVRVKKGEITG
ncbi:hypothetical protein ASU31_19310 [Pedobacter ginsenosidimutans]|uniref:Uncharacterized protein n=1 Tax=Pedobacter ginsenosidimutans TaxID=687842 RepID=A0A0T5VKN8_9SPHI|nr:hypothetical protein ASU31_19310 [Pedobacter ginsenosidimutans]